MILVLIVFSHTALSLVLYFNFSMLFPSVLHINFNVFFHCTFSIFS